MTTGAGFQGCSIDDQDIMDLSVQPPTKDEFFVFVQSIEDVAVVEVAWEEIHFCPTQSDIFIIGVFHLPPIHVSRLQAACGHYTIFAERIRPDSAKCQITSNKYPIPNWVIVNDTISGSGCSIQESFI